MVSASTDFEEETPYQAPSLDEILKSSRDEAVDQYNKFHKLMTRTHKKLTTEDGRKSQTKYPDDLVISFRSACEAKDSLKLGNKITYTQIARAHKISAGTAEIYRTDFTHRPECMATPELIETFREQYRAATAEIRVIKAIRRGDDPKNIKKLLNNRPPELTFTVAMKLLKKHCAAFPEDHIDALLVIRAMLLAKRIDRKKANDLLSVLLPELLPFKELKDPEDSK